LLKSQRLPKSTSKFEAFKPLTPPVLMYDYRSKPGALLKSNDFIFQNGLLTIDPPYRSIDCKATNEIILQRVSNLVSRHEEEEKGSCLKN
jgi:hypothetical protein